jgi:hypothetical protein
MSDDEIINEESKRMVKRKAEESKHTPNKRPKLLHTPKKELLPEDYEIKFTRGLTSEEQIVLFEPDTNYNRKVANFGID